MNPLIELVLAEARRYLDVREKPRDSNRSIEIDYWLEAVGVPLALPWCAAFVYNVGRQALGTTRWPLPRTASCVALRDWAARSSVPLMTTPAAGDVFLLWEAGLTPARFGHTGFVTGMNADGSIATIEGNTNPGGSRDGYGVFARTRHPAPADRFIHWAPLVAA